MPHHRQYAILRWVGVRDQDATLVWETENMDDGELLRWLRRRRDDLPPIAQRILADPGKMSKEEFVAIERYDCCYVCLERSPCSVLRGESPRPSFLKRLFPWS